MSKKYELDIFAGGITQFRKIVEREQAKMVYAATEMVDKMADDAIEKIQSNANAMITHNYEAYQAVSLYNEFAHRSLLDVLIINTHQQATYSEYGTGIIGSQTPHPDPKMGWKYDVNEHGEKGWRYQNEAGQWVHTKGLPSAPVYMITALELRGEVFERFKEKYEEADEKLPKAK